MGVSLCVSVSLCVRLRVCVSIWVCLYGPGVGGLCLCMSVCLVLETDTFEFGVW